MRSVWLCLALLQMATARVAAQLRPLEPLDWRAIDSAAGAISVGSSVFTGQRASLAGTEGSLFELGVYSAVLHFGRVSIQMNGAALRLFYDDEVFAAPAGGALPAAAPRRDTGDHQIHTLIRLTPEDRPAGVVLRFGVRLPTTDNFKGLERDQTDFVMTVGGRLRRGDWSATGEFGVGVHSTRDSDIEQIDPLLYAVVLGYAHRQMAVRVVLVGQEDTRARSSLRGTEDLRESRLEFEFGGARFLRVSAYRGWEAFSPDFGLGVSTGLRF